MILILYILLLLVAVLVYNAKAIYFFVKEYRRKSRYADLIFGLPPLPIIGNLHQLPRNSYENCEFFIRESHRALKNGENLYRWRFWNKMAILILNGETAKVIIDSNTEIKKGMDYDFYRLWIGDGLLLSHDNRWRALRKMSTPIFHFSMLDGYIAIFNQQSRILLGKLGKTTQDKEDSLTDVYSLIKLCALDIIIEATMGIKIEAQLQSNLPYINAVQMFNEYAYIMAISPHYWNNWIWYLFGYGKETDNIVDTLHEFSNKAIEEHLKTIETTPKENDADVKNDDELTTHRHKGKPFLDFLLEMQKQGQLSMEDVRQQVDTFIFAGHDTTAHALSWTVWCFATHPDIQNRVFDEICENFGSAIDDPGREFDAADVGRLKYLEMCLKEAMRIFSPVPILERTLRNDMIIDGKLVPKGSEIIISPFVIHHNYKIYPNHDEFNPDNFLPENIAKRHPYDYIPFSAGPRNCIGQRFAMLETKVVLAHIIWRFSLSTTYTFHDNVCGAETILRPKLGIPISIKSRYS